MLDFEKKIEEFQKSQKEQVLNSIATPIEDYLEKARQIKYFKREGTPGHYKYYYTKEEYGKAKGEGKQETSDSSSQKVGAIVKHEGKSYKKQSNGKWLEVSGDGMTKKEHNERKDAHIVATAYGDRNKEGTSAYKNQQKANEHILAASKLSDKEHSDKEVGLGEKKKMLVEPSSKKVGDTIEHNGKKYKKQPNDKWVEVSKEHNMSEKEHKEFAAKEYQRAGILRRSGSGAADTAIFNGDYHKEIASKLSNKEHSDEEVGLG